MKNRLEQAKSQSGVEVTAKITAAILLLFSKTFNPFSSAAFLHFPLLFPFPDCQRKTRVTPDTTKRT